MGRNTIIIGSILLIVFGAVYFVMTNSKGDRIQLPKGEESKPETIVIKDGEVLGTTEEVEMTEEEMKLEENVAVKEIMVTGGQRHSVPLDEIQGGGPAKDGIPSIDNPKYVGIDEANEWLTDTEPGIAVSRGNIHRFYPYQILVWHELVNDTIEGERVLISYCPLCLTGVVFDPVVQGERVEFGTSGLLWQSNLVMYDRKTDSLWSQVLGESILGEMTGTALKTLPSDQALYGKWKEQYPNGEVLSKDTGAVKFYGSNPYGSYYDVQSFSLRMVTNVDSRLSNDAFVFGVVVNGKAKAYDVEAIKAIGEVVDTFEGTEFVLRHNTDLDVVQIFKKVNNKEERVNPFSTFWFSWVAAHPNTELYQ